MKTKDATGLFLADVTSPEPRRLYLSHTGIEASSFGSFDWLGWTLAVSRFSESGEELPFRDHWEESLLEILRYPENYSDHPLEWRSTSSGEPVDLRAQQPIWDASRRFETAIRTQASPDGEQRLCFNLYDDGRYRYTLERLICDGALSAWLPRGWSGEHSDLESAEIAACRAFEWFH